MLRRVAIVVSLVVGPILAGCAAPESRHGIRQRRPVRDILFNSHVTIVPSHFIGRSDWPSTSAYTYSVEQIDHRVTIFDRQEPSEHGRDHQSRTFRSIRTGRARR